MKDSPTRNDPWRLFFPLSFPRAARYGAGMSVFLRIVFLTCIGVLSGCSMFQKKSSSSIIEGDSPTIKYTNPESAGGRVGGR